jgi:hypothetical protein
MRLTDAVCTILSLLQICASPIWLSKHNVTCRREGDALAGRLDVTNEKLTVGSRWNFSAARSRSLSDELPVNPDTPWSANVSINLS